MQSLPHLILRRHRPPLRTDNEVNYSSEQKPERAHGEPDYYQKVANPQLALDNQVVRHLFEPPCDHQPLQAPKAPLCIE